MDWTGGTRRRYAQTGKNNDVVQKQKAHFARVRNAGQPHPPSSMPDFMREAVVSKGFGLTTASQQRRSSTEHGARSGSRSSTSGAGAGAARRRDHAADTRNSAARQQLGSSYRHGHRVRDVGRVSASHGGSQRSRDQPRSAKVTDAESTLHAARSRLLARSDWLGLNASRPLKIVFPKNRNNDRVGKRRKVKKASPRISRQFQQRRVTPPFQHRDRLVQPMLSEGGDDESISIKIGTDAFDSQTQLSRPSRTVANTSMRQPSTESGPISEESMLMGEEGDNAAIGDESSFYTQRSAQTQHNWHTGQQDWLPEHEDAFPVESRQWPPMQTSGFTQNLAYIPSAPSMQPIDAVLQDDDDDSYVVANHNTNKWITHHRGHQHVETAQPRLPIRDSFPQPAVQSWAVQNPAQGLISDDEGRWRKMLHIRTAAPTDASVAALKSSSLHQTQSTLSYAPQSQLNPSLPPQLEQPTPSQQAEQSEDIFRPVSEAGLDEMAPQNPIAATQRVNATIDDNSRTGSPVSGTARDDELWRQFVCGSQDSDVDFMALEDRAPDGANDVASVPQVASNTSEQHRSDRVTVGGSTLEASLTTNSESASFARDGVGNTSTIGHAGTAYQEVDEIEEDLSVSPPRKRSKSNMHASALSHNRKRFQKARRLSQPKTLPKRPRRVLLSSNICPTANNKSVYDIPSTGD